MIAPWRLTLAVSAALTWSTASFAQVFTPPPPGAPGSEEPPPARIQLGPVGVKPAAILREIGYDSNVLNRNTNEQGDFTATVGARVDVGTRVSRLLANSSSFYEYLYFKDVVSERGSNLGAEGRVDFLFGRVRPHLVGGIRTSHDRPSPEIDTRPLRMQTTVGAGLAVASGSHTTFNAAYRREAADFADDEVFRGVNLADELNLRSQSLTYGAAFELSPLTTVSVHREERRDRFTTSADRDADSHRYGITASLNPLALISGEASVGVAAFRPLSAVEPEFTGVTAAVAVAYAFHDVSRVALSIDRDLRHSFIEETPYYIATGGRVTFRQRLFRNIDGQATAGFDRIDYEARLDEAQIRGNQQDRVRLAGGGIGVGIGKDARLVVNYDRTSRLSPMPSREYSRGRVLATLSYGL